MKRISILSLIFLAGCIFYEERECDNEPPSPPRGVYSVTGDKKVYLYWIPNPEPDLAGYRVWRSYSPDGPYRVIGETNCESFVDFDVINGVTYYYAVTAFDFNGNESEFSYEIVFDTPRPEGIEYLESYTQDPDEAGYDFSEYEVKYYLDPETDFFYEYDDTLNTGFIYARDEDTWMQDMGYTENFDEIGYAPIKGWSNLGVLEAIEGHTYIFWTRDNHFAKIRIEKIYPDGRVKFRWAYQIDEGNRELKVGVFILKGGVE
ncbi:MAG: hypothetical protein ABIM60_06430 [candidate division WOR-3 bacterium]